MVKRLKDKNAPKRPSSGFILFGNDMRANDESIKNLAVTQQAQTIAKLWKDLDDGAKSVYIQRAEELKTQYKQDIEEYKKTDSYKEFQKVLKDSKSGKTKKKGSGRMSGYRLFVKENKDVIDQGLDEEASSKKHIAKCGIKWNMLSENEKMAYSDRAAQMNMDQAAEASSEDD